MLCFRAQTSSLAWFLLLHIEDIGYNMSMCAMRLALAKIIIIIIIIISYLLLLLEWLSHCETEHREYTRSPPPLHDMQAGQTRKKYQNNHTYTYCKRNRSLLTFRRGTESYIEHHRTTRPPPIFSGISVVFVDTPRISMCCYIFFHL